MNAIFRQVLVWGLLLTGFGPAGAQTFSLSLEEIEIPDLPGKQSYVYGVYGGEWLVFSGRTEGLHRPQPSAAFPPEANNREVLVVNPNTRQVWSTGIATLPAPLQEQVQSSNLNFTQDKEHLYACGGYAHAAAQDAHTTFDRMLVVDLAGAIAAVKANGDLSPHFHSFQDPRMAVTGGQLARLGDDFYLVGGHRFEGVYNPNGAEFGDGFVQEYTNAIRRFQIAQDSAGNFQLTNCHEVVDSLQLHRRDFNLIPQVFSDGEPGFTAFSGVFQYEEDLPWLNAVHIGPGGYRVVPEFEQIFSHYNCARLPLYSKAQGAMHNYFFGGMAQYYLDEAGELVNDLNVPFVKMISRVTRRDDGQMAEYNTGMEMPGFLGAGAELIPNPGAPWLPHGVLEIDLLPEGRQLVGYIYGGIESSERNLFFTQEDRESWPSRRVFEVYIEWQD